MAGDKDMTGRAPRAAGLAAKRAVRDELNEMRRKQIKIDDDDDDSDDDSGDAFDGSSSESEDVEVEDEEEAEDEEDEEDEGEDEDEDEDDDEDSEGAEDFEVAEEDVSDDGDRRKFRDRTADADADSLGSDDEIALDDVDDDAYDDADRKVTPLHQLIIDVCKSIAAEMLFTKYDEMVLGHVPITERDLSDIPYCARRRKDLIKRIEQHFLPVQSMIFKKVGVPGMKDKNNDKPNAPEEKKQANLHPLLRAMICDHIEGHPLPAIQTRNIAADEQLAKCVVTDVPFTRSGRTQGYYMETRQDPNDKRPAAVCQTLVTERVWSVAVAIRIQRAFEDFLRCQVANICTDYINEKPDKPPAYYYRRYIEDPHDWMGYCYSLCVMADGILTTEITPGRVPIESPANAA